MRFTKRLMLGKLGKKKKKYSVRFSISKSKRNIKFFERICGFSSPYRVFCDTKMVKIAESVRRVCSVIFPDGVNLVTTNCVLVDAGIEKPSCVSVQPCFHPKQGVGSEACIKKVIGFYNFGKYVLATNQRKYVSHFTALHGTPILYWGVGHILCPSQFQVNFVQEAVAAHLRSRKRNWVRKINNVLMESQRVFADSVIHASSSDELSAANFQFFVDHYGFHQPFGVFFDGESSFKWRIFDPDSSECAEIYGNISRLLHGDVTLHTSSCVLECFIDDFVDTVFDDEVVDRVLLRCVGHDAYDDCLGTMVGNGNPRKLIVFTSGEYLVEHCSKIGGVPIIFCETGRPLRVLPPTVSQMKSVGQHAVDYMLLG